MTADGLKLYTAAFWRVFAGAAVFMTGVALQFHFGQYIAHLGHNVDTLGWLLALSTAATLGSRLPSGRRIDRFGCRRVMVWGAVLAAIATAANPLTDELWLVATLRMVATVAVAAVMTAVAVFAGQIAPPQRRAESIGTLGLAGFLGMLLGSSLGDVVFAGESLPEWRFHLFFYLSAALSLIAAWIAGTVGAPPGPNRYSEFGDTSPGAPGPTSVAADVRPPGRRNIANNDLVAESGSPHPAPLPRGEGERPIPRIEMGLSFADVIRLVRGHWPGSILLVGVVFHMVLCLHFSYLERLAESAGFRDVKVFFLLYGPTAVLLRITCRRWPEYLGLERTIVFGMSMMIVGVLLLVNVRHESGLILPGFFMGAGHSLVFPSMVDFAARRMPEDNRGLATAMILGAGDVGMLVGFAVLGELIDSAGYNAAIFALAASLMLGTVVFAIAQRRSILVPFPREEATAAREASG